MLDFSRSRRSFRGPARSRRGISDVVGTILLLGLTVTLFGTVFLFVNTFPQPAPQPTSQFAAQLSFQFQPGVGTVINYLNITHLAGPTIFNSPSNQIFISSAQKPGAFTGPYSVAAGGLVTWAIGETWSLNVFAKNLSYSDNLTVSVVSANQLLYHNTLPGESPSIPPQFTNEGTVPAKPTMGVGFSVFAQISDANLPTTSTHVTANYSLIPGLYGAPPVQMTYSAQNGTWQCSVPNHTTSSGVYFIFVSAIDTLGLRNTVAVPVNLQVPGVNIPGDVNVVVALNQTVPVNGTASTIIGTIFNNGFAGGTASMKFFVNGVLLGTSTGPITAGGILTLYMAWSPSATGTAVIVAQGNVPGVGEANGTMSLTIFPKIAFIVKNTGYTTAHTYGAADEAGWLRAALVDDGIPFTTFTYSCKSNLPAAATFNGYQVIIADYGSNTQPACGTLTASDATTLTTLTTTASVWLVGANPWSTAVGGCPSAAFQTAFGLKSGAVACGATIALPATNTGVLTPSVVYGLQGAGVPATYTVNKSIAANTTFQAINISGALQAGFTSVPWFKVGASVVGTFLTHGGFRSSAILSIDPAMLVHTLPGGQNYGTGAGASEVVYNVVDWLSGLTPPGIGTTDRQQVDFAITEVQVLGTKHAAASTVAVDVRSNGIAGGAVTVILLINGTPALYGGQVVSNIIYLNGGGASTFLTLTWQTQLAGPYTITAEVFGTSDVNVLNNEFGTGLLPQPVVFT